MCNTSQPSSSTAVTSVVPYNKFYGGLQPNTSVVGETPFRFLNLPSETLRIPAEYDVGK